MSYVYGVLYMLFEAYPVSFHDDRGCSLGVSALPYCSFVVGISMGMGLLVWSTKTQFAPAYIKYGKPIPEKRLPPMIIGAIIMPIAFFWFGWTSFPSITFHLELSASNTCTTFT